MRVIPSVCTHLFHSKESEQSAGSLSEVFPAAKGDPEQRRGQRGYVFLLIREYNLRQPSAEYCHPTPKNHPDDPAFLIICLPQEQHMDRRSLEGKASESSTGELYPWYVHLLSGYVLTGAFCWLLVAGIYRRNGKRKTAAILVAINALILAVMVGSTLQLKMAWWQLDSLIMTLNLVWSLSAWAVQYFRFGPALRRYHPAAWRRWVSPLLIGVLLGLGFAVTSAVMPAIGDRITALGKGQAVVRSVVLWAFFKDLVPGLVVGLLAGAWWAGQPRFTIAHVISFLMGITLVFTAQALVFGLAALLFNGGDPASLEMFAGDAWALVPGRLHGWPHLIEAMDDYNYIAFVPVGMLFGAPGRIRDFLKRSAVVVPALVLLVLFFSFSTHAGWMMLQGPIIHQTASADDQERTTAFSRLELLLARYPDHAQWPYLAARLADFRYARGETEASRRIHQQIADRFADTNQWHVQAAMSRAILEAPRFGKPSRGPLLSIPMVNYQDYLSRNWMALLAAARYWQTEETPVSELFIRLREISKDDDAIRLPELTGLAELDDAAAALGYAVTILPADADASRALLDSGFPVILPVYQTFYLLYGFDDSREVIQSLCFGQLSQKTKSLAVKEAQEVLMLEAEGKGRTRDRLKRIRREADCMWHLDQWRKGRLRDAAPWMAIVHPDHLRPKIAAALGRDTQELYKAHRGFLAAMIALNYFDNADPVNCIRWAEIAGRSIDAPLVHQAGYLGAQLWRRRTERIGTAFHLEKRFAALDEVRRYLQSAAVREFIHTADGQFKADQESGRLNWPIRRRLLWLLDRNDPQQRQQMISLLLENLSTNPADVHQWRLLTNLYAMDENLAARARALSQAWSANPRNAATGLAWAAACVRLDDPAQAEQILAKIDASRVRQNADYPFCLGAVAEWKRQPGTARRYYAQAIDMCRYRPEYFLRYGRLLMAQGDRNAAEKALTWAARIDGGGQVREQVQNALRQ